MFLLVLFNASISVLLKSYLGRSFSSPNKLLFGDSIRFFWFFKEYDDENPVKVRTSKT